MEEIRNIVNLLALFGVPSLCACAVYFAKACIKFGKKQDTLANAIQKMMARDLTQDYHGYMSQGFIDDDDLTMWENSYQAYHSLGKNGIMDSRRQDLIELNSKSIKSK